MDTTANIPIVHDGAKQGGYRIGETFASYAAMRASKTAALSMVLTGFLVMAAPDGTAGTFVRDDSDTTSADNGGTIIVRADGVRYKRAGVGSDVQLSWFGVSASASAAVNNAAFVQYQQYANSRLVTSSQRSEKNGSIVGVLPPGEIQITADKAMFDPANFTSPSIGTLAYRGAGLYRTTILWSPAGSNYSLINNDNKTLEVELTGIGFNCNSASATFMYSNRAGISVQGFRSTQCYWTGTWQYGVNLVGGNNNSEHFYDRCGFYGVWTAWQFVAASGTSDQFLNYNYQNCKYWSSSCWIDMSMGGAIRIRDCDISGYSPAADTYLFNLRGFTHANGVCSFYINNVRAELRTIFAHVLYSEWGDGIIEINGFDTQSQAGVASMASAEHFTIVPGNNPGPLLKFTKCQLIGKARYITYGGATSYSNRFSYNDCSFYSQVRFTDYFVFDITSASGNLGGVPQIDIKNSRCAPGSKVHSDASLNWNASTSGNVAELKWASFALGSGGRPYSGQPATLPALPIGARLRKLLLVAEPGHCVDANPRTMTLTVNGVTAATFTTGGNYDAGFDTEVAAPFVCNTAAKAENIVLTNTATGQSATATMMVGGFW